MPEQPPYIKLKPYLHPFTEAQDVFASAEHNGGVSPEQAAYLAPPLLSIDLAAVNPDWVGRIHIVTVLEDSEITDGYFADGMEAFHSYYTHSNWIGFQLDDHSRYSLLGDWRCFYQQHQDLPFSYDKKGQTYEGYVKGQDFLQQWSAGRIRGCVPLPKMAVRLSILVRYVDTSITNTGRAELCCSTTPSPVSPCKLLTGHNTHQSYKKVITPVERGNTKPSGASVCW